MKTNDFKRLIRTEEPKRILFRYMFAPYEKVDGIFLTDKQLQKVIDLKNKKSR